MMRNFGERRAFVIRELGRHRDEDQVILDLCEGAGMKWGEAERFVEHIRAVHEDEIKGRRKPIVVGLALAVILTGVIMIAIILLATLRGIFFFYYLAPVPFLGNAAGFLVGAGMVLGGVLGLLRIYEE